MAGIFKAYDVRGLYPEQLNEKMAHDIGLAYRHLIEHQGPEHGRVIVVGHDMRSHSLPLLRALTEGLLAGGLDVVDIGLTTTPMNYFAVGHLGAAGGIQVTASHNPAAYNGFKFSLYGARPVSGDFGIPLLEKHVQEQDLPAAEHTGRRSKTDITGAYGDRLLSFLESPRRRLKVVVDAANGMGCIYRPLLESTGIDLVPLYFELDGTFPNHEANPLKLENLDDLCDRVRSESADLGVSFDGDADRAAFVDEQGEPIGSDLVTALIAGQKLERQGPGIILYDVRSSRAVAEYIREKGGEPRRERVGHSFIKATLRAENALFGGELAGHYYFPETCFADSSLLAVIEVLNLLGKTDQTLSSLLAPLTRYAKSPEINFEVEDKEGALARLEEHFSGGEIDRLDGISIDFPDWWFNARPSNTEPVLRLVVEATTPEALAVHQAELVALLGDPL